MAGTTKTITGISKANPAVVTTSGNHGLSTGNYVYISGINGMWQLSSGVYRVTKIDNTNVSLQGVDSRYYNSYSTYSGSASMTGCLDSGCDVLVTTSSAHNQSTGDTVYISGASGMSGLNGTHSGDVGTVPNTTSYYLTDEGPDTVGYNTYTANSAKSYCTDYGCTYYYFQNAAGGYNTYKVNTCASERTGTHAFDDTAPSTTPLNFYYESGGANCISQQIQPLTTDKTVLHALANSLTATNSTAGHLGLAWGWYMISPNFGYLWPTASQPAAYGKNNLIKAVVLMTDGEFNTQYCNGVLSQDSINGSNTDQIACNAPDGSSHDQAVTLCTNIKAPANSTILYTVGFDLGTDTYALNFLQSCATDPTHFFQADTGTDLTAAFTQIAQNLNSLRLSK